MESLDRYIARLGLTMDEPEEIAGSAQENPLLFELGQFHRCRIAWRGRELVIDHPYGFPDGGKTAVQEVLDDAAADAVCVDSACGFSDWAERFHGVPLHHPGAVLTVADYGSHKKKAAELKAFLGYLEYLRLKNTRTFNDWIGLFYPRIESSQNRQSCASSRVRVGATLSAAHFWTQPSRSEAT